MKKSILYILFITAIVLLLNSCSSARHVPEGKYLLNDIHINIDDSTKSFNKDEMINYVRQQPNHKILWAVKLQLGVYNISGKDSTKWYNKWVRKLGEAPVIYDSTLTSQSVVHLRKAMENRGYLDAKVTFDTTINEKKRKINVDYTLIPGLPHKIKSIEYEFPNDSIKDIIMADSSSFIVRNGDNLDQRRLDALRTKFTEKLQNSGYYAFTKEFVTFNADTTENSYDVDLTVMINPPYAPHPGAPLIQTHKPHYIRNIIFVTNYDPTTFSSLDNLSAKDTVTFKDITVFYGDKHYLRPSVLEENCYLSKGEPFNTSDVNKTYQALNRLTILKFINIQFDHIASFDGKEWLDAYILLSPGKSQSASVELEGTNSEGDLGVAASISYNHRNIGRGSETLSAKVRGAYESLSGNLEGLINNRYMEYSLDLGISFPKFMFPFLKKEFKQKVKATTDFNTSINYQERPEYTRIITTAGWNFRWAKNSNRLRHTFTPIDINYVYLPESTNDFIDQIAPDNPLLRYSYEDHFIMRMGYSFYYTNKPSENVWQRFNRTNVSTVRINTEIAGNLLYAINNIFNYHPNASQDPYKVFGIQYSQYFKFDGDYSLTHSFSPRHSLAFHVGMGVAYPYGNSGILPFEKRFYGGGANGVRGWDVRTLGPGKFNGSNSVSSFINQCGDIRFIMSLEYRAKLFWVIEMAAFIDAGNIWTIKDYENQPGGLFRFSSFYKELAVAYGLGIRLDFNYFLLRLDMGMKAYNPAEGQEKWPLIHPRWGRDRSFHFSIGYPF